jgi:hypothetical protein
MCVYYEEPPDLEHRWQHAQVVRSLANMEALTITERQQPATTLEAWGQKVARLFEKAEESRRKIDSVAWEIGDALVAGERQFKKAAMEEAQRVTGKSESTLLGFRRVASTFPPSRRVANLFWSHYKEVADYVVDEEKQDKVLAEAVQRKTPVKRLRKQLQKKEAKLEQGEKERRFGKVKFVRIPLGLETALTLKRLGNARDERPEQILSEVVTKHFSENLEAISREVEAWEAHGRETRREARKLRKADKAKLEALRDERKRFEDYFFDLRNRTGQPVPQFIKGYLEKECGHARWLEIPLRVFEDAIAKVKEAGDDPHEQVKRLQMLSWSEPQRLEIKRS